MVLGIFFYWKKDGNSLLYKIVIEKEENEQKANRSVLSITKMETKAQSNPEAGWIHVPI